MSGIQALTALLVAVTLVGVAIGRWPTREIAERRAENVRKSQRA